MGTSSTAVVLDLELVIASLFAVRIAILHCIDSRKVLNRYFPKMPINLSLIMLAVSGFVSYDCIVQKYGTKMRYKDVIQINYLMK